MEQSNEWQRNIYINFVDFEKEFDSSTEETYGKCYDTTESLRKLQKLSANFKITLPVAYRAL